MAIKDIFKMIKADRYTQDGREELIKAQEAVTEDVTYKPGDISRKTGLQKQPDGSWAPVKNAPAQSKKSDKTTPEEMSKIKELKTQYSKAKTDEERSAIANKVNEIMGVNERMSAEAKKETELRSEAASGDPQKRKALFDFQAQKASDEEIDMVLSAKERGVNHPADFIESYKEEKAKRSASGSAPSADWEKDIPNASNEELENIVKLEEKLPRMSEQSRSEFAPKIEKAKAELYKRADSGSVENAIKHSKLSEAQLKEKLKAKFNWPDDMTMSDAKELLGEKELAREIVEVDKPRDKPRAGSAPKDVKSMSISELKEQRDKLKSGSGPENDAQYKKINDELTRKRLQTLSVGSEVKAHGTPLKITSINPDTNTIRGEFDHKGEKLSTTIGLEDIDDYDNITESGGSAPRILTGDCKVRIRKSK